MNDFIEMYLVFAIIPIVLLMILAMLAPYPWNVVFLVIQAAFLVGQIACAYLTWRK